MPSPLKWRGKKFPAEAKTQMARERRGKRQPKYDQAPPEGWAEVWPEKENGSLESITEVENGEDRLSSNMQCSESILNCSLYWGLSRAPSVWAMKSSPAFPEDPVPSLRRFHVDHPRWRPLQLLLPCFLTWAVGFPCPSLTWLAQAGLKSLPKPWPTEKNFTCHLMRVGKKKEK